MRYLTVYVFALLFTVPVLSIAQAQNSAYIWNRKGVVVYSAPDTRIVADTLSYGTKIEVLDVSPAKEKVVLFTYQSDTVLKSYSHTSSWIRIKYGNHRTGYVPDTYLLESPPNTAVIISDYLSEISDVVQQKDEGKTDEFCSRSDYTYQNGIRYSFTDLGPCESCGHSVTEITLPGWTLHQAFVFITNFSPRHWDMDGVLTDSYPDDITIVGRKDTQSKEFQWEFAYDTVVLTETENEVIVRIDTIL